MDTTERTRRIVQRLGDDAQVLRDAGIDLEASIATVLDAEAQRQASLAARLAKRNMADVMTSELALLSGRLSDAFGDEYVRRLSAIGLSDAQVREAYDNDAYVLADASLADDRAQPWAGRIFFRWTTKPADLPTPDQLTLSELVLITDDASSAYVRDHHALDKDAWAAVCTAAVQAQSFGGAKYAFAFKARVENNGWSRAQQGAFTRNECMLTERLKWGYHNNPAWTDATTDLAKYG